MFVLVGRYLRPVEEVVAHRPGHLKWIQSQYERGAFLVSGPLDPPPGGLIVTRAENRAEIDEMLASDPYHQLGLIEYSVQEFHESDFPLRSRGFDAFASERS